MRSITKQLDMSPGAVSPVVHVSQYDSDFTIVFTLYCTDGTFTLESGTTAEVRGTKKSGTGYSATAAVNISAKTVTVAGHKQMTAVAGDNIYEITLYKGSKELNSINFVLAVERAAMDQDTVVDETTIREFGELETYIEGVKTDAAASASAANASQTAAAQSATNAANSAIEAAQSAQSVDAERLNRIAFGSYVVESQSGPIAHFEDGADNIPIKDVLVHIEPVQAGSGDPSPDNVRAITGWTAAKVKISGANMFNIANVERLTTGSTFSVDGNRLTVTVDGQYTYQGVRYGGSSNTIFPPGTYYIKANILKLDNPELPNRFAFRNSTSTIGQGASRAITSTGEMSVSITITEPCYFSVLLNGATGSANEIIIEDLIISNTDSTYEPYSGQTYSITFPSSAGTVYGGTLDVTSGVLTVDRQYIELNGTNYIFTLMSKDTYPNTYVFTNRKLGNKLAINNADEITKTLCNYFPSISRIDASSGGGNKTGIFQYHSTTANDFRIAFPLEDRFSTWDKFQAWLQSLETPLAFCLPLKEPLATYQLTPQEITSLLGVNNVWADTGDSDVEYRADTKMYVDAKVAAAVSALS